MNSNKIKILFFLIFVSIIDLNGQDFRKKIVHGLGVGVNFSQLGFFTSENIRMVTPNISYHSLININRQLALELGVNYKPTYIDGLYHSLLAHLNYQPERDRSGYFRPTELQLYHFLDFPVVLSIKPNLRSKDRFFAGANISIPIYQPIITFEYPYLSPNGFILTDDTKYFTSHVEALMGYRLQLEGNSFISVSMAYDVSPAMDKQKLDSNFGESRNFENYRFMSFQFAYHYFFDH